MMEVVDQMENLVSLEKPARRIISLVPSITELLFDLGLNNEVVGITKFCVHPAAWFSHKARVGGTKSLHIEKIFQIQPDLIIANKEENVEAQVSELATAIPVYVSDVNTLDDALQMINHIGVLTDTSVKASDRISKISNAFAGLSPLSQSLKTCYLIWNEPMMTVGGDTFIHHLMERTGLQNIFENKKRYPETSLEEILALDCELLLLSSEPFPFKEKHKAQINHLLSTTGSNSKPAIKLVDGEMFSWYGSRLLLAAEYFRNLQQELALLKTHL